MLRLKCNKLFICVILFQYLEYLYADSNKLKNNLVISLEDELRYLKIIETAIGYYLKDNNEVDISLAFGLFLSNVHLKRSVKDKEEKLPSAIKTKIKNIIRKNDELLKYYKKISNDLNVMSREFIQISKLFKNSTQWVKRLHSLVYREQKSHSFMELENLYTPWPDYLEAINDVKYWLPDPEFSDMCLVSLSLNPSNQRDELSWCPVADSCYKMLKNGTDFGYALQHRIVLLQMAHLGRGCAVFSPKEDRAVMNSYCSMAYAEAQYIAMNNYAHGDLMLEILCLCTLDGRAEFLQRNWLQHLSHFQLSRGCFGDQIYPGLRLVRTSGVHSRLGRKYQQEQCNSHTTGLALGTFSAAIRYINQEYY